MIKASWISSLTIGLLWSATGVTDDVQPSESKREPLQVISLSVKTMLAESAYPPRWRLIHPAGATAYSDDWPRSIADFDFRDADALSRVSKLRRLSLVTLAEVGQIRLFLGVNEDGLAGLHFNALPRYGGEERYLEVIRMPYLRRTSPAAE